MRKEQMMEMLSSYRAIPAMYRVITGQGRVFFRAAKELAIVFDVKPEEVEDILTPYKNWIIYAMSDFIEYANHTLNESEFEQSYWPRMSEEARLVTNNEPFKLNIEKITILDVGAGNAPYRTNFVQANGKHLRYIALDKRYITHTVIKEVKRISLTQIAGDIAAYKKRNHDPEPNVLFLANFLHCLQDIDAFFEEILPLLPELKVIKILEVKPDTALDFLFSYHMFEHSRGQRFDTDCMRSITKSYTPESLGDYHMMYTIKL